MNFLLLQSCSGNKYSNSEKEWNEGARKTLCFICSLLSEYSVTRMFNNGDCEDHSLRLGARHVDWSRSTIPISFPVQSIVASAAERFAMTS